MAVKKKKTGKEPVPVMVPPEGALRFICYLASLFMPVAGFILGAVFFPQKAAENRTFGKNCFIFMAAGLVLALFFVIISMVIGYVAGSISGFESGLSESYY